MLTQFAVLEGNLAQYDTWADRVYCTVCAGHHAHLSTAMSSVTKLATNSSCNVTLILQPRKEEDNRELD
uniref:Uncharacterized protein n=1 Tax=Oncorhynchus tshawytscha TaxID=74940 RepID=A0A8C8J9R0_ONCTS